LNGSHFIRSRETWWCKSGVTLSLLWHEYCESCRLSNEIPLMYSQFCRYYREYANKTKATMRIKRKPGEIT
jgi:hypothetical protein